MKKVVPRFRNEDEEREMWAKRDSTGFISWKKGKTGHPTRSEALPADNLAAAAEVGARSSSSFSPTNAMYLNQSLL
jgi:hypothetical protein